MVTQNIVKFVISGGYNNEFTSTGGYSVGSPLGGQASLSSKGIIQSDTPLNFFDHVTLARANAGEFQYLCYYIYGLNTEVGVALRYWLDRDTLNDESEFAWGFENPANAHPYKYEPHKTFNGSTDYVEVAHSATFNLTQFSITCWFRTSTSDWVDEGFFANKGGTGSETAGQNLNYGMWMNVTGNIVAGFEESAGTDHYATSPLAYDDGKWHFACVTYDGANVKLYIDGNTTPVATHATATTPDTGTNPFRIGVNSRTLADWYHGDLDEVRVWNNDLTSAEMAALYSAGTVPQTAAMIYENKFGDDNGSLIAQVIANINTAPTGVTFSTAGSPPEDANISDIKLGTDWYRPIWVRRRIIATAGSPNSVDNKGIFNLSLELKRIGSFPTEEPNDPAGTDTFGINKLNATASGGREWFSNWHTATSHQWTSSGTSSSNRDPQDNLVDLHCPSGNVAKVDDATDTMESAAGSDAWRLYVNDPNKEWNWQPNLEMTCYYYAMQNQGGGAATAIPIRMVGPTEHQLEYQCSGSGHGVGFEISYSAGTAHGRKEYAHDFYGVKMFASWKTTDRNKWIGVKYICRKVGADKMLYRAYIDLTDGASGGTWTKVWEFLDTGNWPLNSEDRQGFLDSNDGSGKCAKVEENQVLNMAASSCYLRNDGLNCKYKKFSIREIDPLPEGSTGGDGGGGGGGGSQPPPQVGNFNMFMTADSDCKSVTDDLIAVMVQEDTHPDAFIIAGDIQYTSNPNCIIQRLDPFHDQMILAMGNHDSFNDYSGEFALPKSYYSKRVGNVHICVMNSETSFSVGSAQHTFVTDDLTKASQDANVDWIFVVIHRPFYSADSDHPDNEGGKTDIYMPIFDAAGVDVIVQGHNHNNQRSVQIKAGSGDTPTIIDSNTSTYTKGRGRIVLTCGSGGHDSGSALYGISGHKSYNVLENDSDNCIVEFSFSEGNNAVLTGRFLTTESEVIDTFTINP